MKFRRFFPFQLFSKWLFSTSDWFYRSSSVIGTEIVEKWVNNGDYSRPVSFFCLANSCHAQNFIVILEKVIFDDRLCRWSSVIVIQIEGKRVNNADYSRPISFFRFSNSWHAQDQAKFATLSVARRSETVTRLQLDSAMACYQIRN